MNIAFVFNIRKSQSEQSVLPNEAELEYDSPDTIEGIARALRRNGHKVVKIEADIEVFNRLREIKNRIDLVFNIAEGVPGDARESQVPLYCEVLKIPYTHSSPTVHAVSLNKSLTKMVVSAAGVHVPYSQILEKDTDPTGLKLKFPLIIKPNEEGSSKGISDKNVIGNRRQLLNRVSDLRKTDLSGNLLLEQYIEGREFTVAIIGNRKPQILPVIEQRFDFLPEGMNRVAGIELKWVYEDSLKDLSQAYYCPAPLTAGQKREIDKFSLAAYRSLGVRDCARIDYRMDKRGKIYFLEINTLPGMIPDLKIISYFPLAARRAGISYDKLIDKIVNLAAERYALDN